MKDEHSRAVELLNNVIDASLVPRKVIADDLGMSIGTLSKMTTGINAFGLDTFELLDRDIQKGWLKQYGKLLGLEVHEIPQARLMEEVFDAIDTLKRAVAMARISPRQMKAELPTGVEGRRRA